MGNSQTLSVSFQQSHQNGVVNSEDSIKTEHRVKKVLALSFNFVENKYKNLKFLHEDKIYKSDINSIVKRNFNQPELGTNQSVKSSFIRPDGGIIWIIINNKKYPLMITEAKKQGSNDKRAAKGLPKQGKGNAIERAYKNIKEGELIFNGEDFFSYIILCKGCDLEDTNSSIRDRLTSSNLSSPFDKLYLKKVEDVFGGKHCRTSWFIKQMSDDELFNIYIEALEYAIQYYIKKYNLNNE
jgi:type II restriction enzyme